MTALALAGGIVLVGCSNSDEKTRALEKRIAQLEKQVPSPDPSASPSVVDISPGAQAYTLEPLAAPAGRIESQSVPQTATRGVTERSAPHRRTAAPAAPSRSRDAASRSASAPSVRTPSKRAGAEPVEHVGEDEAREANEALDKSDRQTSDRAASARDGEAVAIPAGTQLALRLETPLSSAQSHPGDRVVARVERATGEDGTVALPGGTVLEGRVTEAAGSGRVSGRARVSVAFDRIVVRGRSHPLEATTISAEAADTHERDAKIIGGSAVAGAILGGIKGGKGGAAKGAVIGAGAGTGAVLVTKGKEVEMPAGSRWVVRVRNGVRL
jgi:hypothetical protein